MSENKHTAFTKVRLCTVNVIDVWISCFSFKLKSKCIAIKFGLLICSSCANYRYVLYYAYFHIIFITCSTYSRMVVTTNKTTPQQILLRFEFLPSCGSTWPPQRPQQQRQQHMKQPVKNMMRISAIPIAMHITKPTMYHTMSS